MSCKDVIAFDCVALTERFANADRGKPLVAIAWLMGPCSTRQSCAQPYDMELWRGKLVTYPVDSYLGIAIWEAGFRVQKLG